MPAAAFTKFNCFALDLGKGVHQLHAAGHTLKAYLSNATPSLSLDLVMADLAEIATGFGYAGPVDIQNDFTASGNVGTLTAVDFTITGAGGDIGPFRYVVVMNDSVAGKPLIGYCDYGASITLHDLEPFLTDFGASLCTITV
jgi:hypothetical protein